jgi:ABC-type spermidine/putrescine transport system permease subunit I
VYTSLLVGPSVAVTLLLVAVPTLIIIYYSVLTRDTNGLLLPILTLQNYAELFTEERYAIVLVRSLGLAFATTALCFIISFPIAYWIAMYGGRWRNFLIFLIILPSWTSYLVRVYAWLFLLKDSGFILSALKFLNIIPEDARVQLLFDWKAVIIVMVYSYMDFMIIPLYAALIRLDRSALEAASDLGARPWRRIFSVTLPMIRGGILAGSVLVFVPAIGEFLVPSLIGGNKVNMVGNLLDLTFLQTDNWALGSAMAVVLSILILVMIWFYLRSAGKEGAMERLT